MTNLMLLNVPFESDYKDTIYFPDVAQQLNYMRSRRVHNFTDFTYQRKDNIIRIPMHIDNLYNCNYVMYQNTITNADGESRYSKWFFAFIVDMQFINEERTDITIQTDVIQTWMFDYTVKPSFVEREHVDDDTIGMHTVPEVLETGEYVCDHKTDKRSLIEKCVIIGSTLELKRFFKEETIENVSGVYYGGVYSGVKYYAFTTAQAVNDVLVALADEGRSDAIVSIFMAPFNMIEIDTTPTEWNGFYNLLSGTVPVKQEWNYEFREGEPDVLPTAPATLDGYTPKNNKLLTFPYCYLYASNNSGGGNIYQYELFKDRNVGFYIYGSLTPSMSIRMLPINYKGVEENNSEGVNLGKLPICSWNTDVYTNWLTQNAVNIGIDVVNGVAQMAVGAVATFGTGGLGAVLGGGSFVSGASSIAGTVGSIYQHALIPPAVNGNINSGDVTYGSGKLTFTLYQMNIKSEYAKIIDNYFDMFGYKVNRVKTPNMNHRNNYWYTKTIDVNIDGAIPNKDLQEIKNCYNKGITFWRSNTYIGDYSVDNAIKE